MSFLGYGAAASSALTSPPVMIPPPLTEAKSSAMSTHSRGAQSRRGRSKRKSTPVIRVFNVAASQPRTSFALTPASIDVSLSANAANFVTTSTIAPTYGSVAVTLQMFVDAAAYTGLFDQYRINEVEVWFTPYAPQGTTSFGSQNFAIDLDDANVPTSINSVTAKQSSVISDGASGTYMRWCPHMAVALFSGAFTSYGNEPADWIDCSSPAVQHYGVKAAFGPTQTNNVLYGYHVKARVSFRSAGL